MAYDDWDINHGDRYDLVSPEQKKLDSASYWLESVLDRLYSDDGDLDEFSLQCDLDELCHLLGVKRQPGLLTVHRKDPKITQFLDGMEA